MGLRRRLQKLEEHPAEREEGVSREVLRRMTDAELDDYIAALKRCTRGEEATPEDLAVAARAGTLREEVEHGK